MPNKISHQFTSFISPYAFIITLTVATSSFIYYWFKKKSKIDFVAVTKVKKLFIYPVKGLKGVEVESLEITENVVKYGNFKDRSWILLDRENRFIVLKHEPKLALTKCSFHNNNELWIDAPDMPTLKLKIIESLKNAKILSFVVYQKEINGIDCGEEAHNWFQKFLCKPGIRLVQHHKDLKYRDTNSNNRRNDDKKFPIIYQNKSGLHLVNESSVNDLNTHFSQGSDPVSYENFRPNVLVDYETPWTEDNWLYMSINGVLFQLLMSCDRCPSTTVDPKTGEPGQETLKALKKFRPAIGISKEKNLGPRFGVIFGPLSKGTINVNDPILVSYGKLDVI